MSMKVVFSSNLNIESNENMFVINLCFRWLQRKLYSILDIISYLLKYCLSGGKIVASNQGVNITNLFGVGGFEFIGVWGQRF